MDKYIYKYMAVEKCAIKTLEVLSTQKRTASIGSYKGTDHKCFRALKLSNFESFWAIKLSRLENVSVLKSHRQIGEF